VGSLADVMAITKCLIWVPPVNRFTVAPRVASHCARAQRLDGLRWIKWRTKMSSLTRWSGAGPIAAEITRGALLATGGLIASALLVLLASVTISVLF
jgi:hypothetical protein